MNVILLDIWMVRIVLIAIGVIGATAIFYAFWKRESGLKKAKGPVLVLDLEKEEPGSQAEPLPAAAQPGLPSAAPAPQIPAFKTLQKKPWALLDVFRAVLVILSLAVAAGFVLILLPQPTVDRMARGLEARYGTPLEERIAFLYLGDEVKDNEFRVRGAVRNITSAPIEKLDAAIRLYSHDRRILETVVVRMDKETIAPDEIAQFQLAIPNYKMEFGSYAVGFKLRQGEPISYKDMRTTRLQSN